MRSEWTLHTGSKNYNKAFWGSHKNKATLQLINNTNDTKSEKQKDQQSKYSIYKPHSIQIIFQK